MRGRLRPLVWARLVPSSPSSPSSLVCRQCRAIRISASPSTETGAAGTDAFGPSSDTPRDDADARFEVLGSPQSLLSVSLSASQKLYTRRGSLVALAGRPESTQSTLSVLSPVLRLTLGVPFLYQRITSTTPVTVLVAAKSPTTSFSVLRLDGTTDWIVSQRNALLAWTGHTLRPSPHLRPSLPLAYWGSTLLTGRGLAALSAPGQTYELRLDDGESFVAHPSHVVAYSISRHAPAPFRFRGSGVRTQVPEALTGWLAGLAWVKKARETDVWKILASWAHAARTVIRRTVWGDRLFLRFCGPGTLLLSSRGVRIADVLTKREVNEIADAPAGSVEAALEKKESWGLETDAQAQSAKDGKTDVMSRQGQGDDSQLKLESTTKDAKVVFEDGKELKDTIR